MRARGGQLQELGPVEGAGECTESVTGPAGKTASDLQGVEYLGRLPVGQLAGDDVHRRR
jgi:hypothetical protein